MPFVPELRERTRAHHERVEAQVDLERRCATPDDYRMLLARFYAFYAPVEAQIVLIPEAERFGMAARRKAPLLARDLAVLGATDAPPVCTDLPPLDTLPRVAGCLYVLEGATLGGQIIARRLNRSLGLNAGTGAAFFHSYGDGVGRMWKSFCRALEDYAADGATREAVVASAEATFDAFGRWLGAEEITP